MSGAPAHLPCRPLRLVESRRIAGRGFNVYVGGGSDEDPLIAKDAMNGAQPQGTATRTAARTKAGDEWGTCPPALPSAPLGGIPSDRRAWFQRLCWRRVRRRPAHRKRRDERGTAARHSRKAKPQGTATWTATRTATTTTAGDEWATCLLRLGCFLLLDDRLVLLLLGFRSMFGGLGLR